MGARRRSYGRVLGTAAVLLGLAFLARACRPVPPPPEAPAPPSSPEPLPEAPGPDRSGCPRIERIEIYKEKRTLVAVCDGGRRFSLRIALGREPEGTKERAGDMRTPEGWYRIAGPPRGSRFHLFIPIDYPSPVDAERGLSAGIISWSTYETIWDASEDGDLPPQDSPLGGYLGLHGEGERWEGDSPYIDWTNGCIAMSDAHIEFLAGRIEVGTPVVILP